MNETLYQFYQAGEELGTYYTQVPETAVGNDVGNIMLAVLLCGLSAIFTWAIYSGWDYLAGPTRIRHLVLFIPVFVFSIPIAVVTALRIIGIMTVNAVHIDFPKFIEFLKRGW
jgi:hypothetical protein